MDGDKVKPANTNIFLIGPMGSGKTAVGKRLAAELGLDFHDSDHAIEERTGVDIAYIFEKEGEAGFRKREAAVIRELTALDGIVLATGGGSPLRKSSRDRLRQHGTVVYLYTTVPEQLRRTGRSKHRPLLRRGDRREVLERLMAERDPLYRDTADIVIETDGRQVAAVTREIKRKVAEVRGSA